MNRIERRKSSGRARVLGFLATGLAALGLVMVFAATSGTTAVHAGDPPPLPQATIVPTEPPPENTRPPEPTTPPPVVTEFVPQVVNTPVPPTATRVPPTATQVPPTATVLSQVVAGVSALPRTGDGAETSGTNWVLMALGATMFFAAAGAGRLAWKASKQS